MMLALIKEKRIVRAMKGLSKKCVSFWGLKKQSGYPKITYIISDFDLYQGCRFGRLYKVYPIHKMCS